MSGGKRTPYILTLLSVLSGPDQYCIPCSIPLASSGKARGARDPQEVGDGLHDVCHVLDDGLLGEAGQDAADAGQLLHEDHGADNAIVAGRVLDVHLVLQQPARAGHALPEAEEHLRSSQLLTDAARLKQPAPACQHCMELSSGIMQKGLLLLADRAHLHAEAELWTAGLPHAS